MKQPNTPTPLTKAEAEAIIREYDSEVRDVVEKIINSEPDTSLQLGAMIEGTTERVRTVIVEHMRRVMQEQEEDKRQELEALLAQQRAMEQQRRTQFGWRRWVTYWISQQVMRRIMWLFQTEPAMKREAAAAAQALAKNGVQATQVRTAEKRDLGGISANVQPSLQQGYEKDRATPRG